MKKYKFIEHTADVAFRAWGQNLEEAFKSGSLAMTDVITNRKKIEKKIVKELEAKGEDKEELLVDWLGQLLYIFDVEKLIFADFDLKIQERGKRWFLKGKGYGEKFEPSKHPSGTNVKGISYSWMKIWKEKRRTYIRVVLDV